MSSNSTVPIILVALLFLVVLTCGCFEKEDNRDDVEEFVDDRPIYNNTISLGPPYFDLDDSNFAIDEDDNLHFIWIDSYHKDIKFHHEVKYSKYGPDMEPIVTNLTIMEGPMPFMVPSAMALYCLRMASRASI